MIRRGHPPVRRQQVWRPAEPIPVVGQRVARIRLVPAAGLLQHRISGDDPALDLVQADLAAELHRLAGPGPRDDLRVRLEQRQHLLAGRDRGRPDR